MATTPNECARELLDVTPVIIQAIRFEMRSQRLTDLTVPQFRTLAYINRHPGSSLSDASEFIGLTLSSMSILVNGLVERGLVRRTVSTQDRRRICLTLTTTGQTMLDAVLHATEARLAELVEPLSGKERATVVRALKLLRPIFLPRTDAPQREPEGAVAP